MRIKLTDNASSTYVRRCYRGAHPACGMLHNPDFAKMLEKVQGQWLEVETDHLFSDQFNTAPIPGVSELGLRVMVSEVAEIQDDARIGVVKCSWCAGYDTNKDGTCDKCGKSEHLAPLNPCSPGCGH
jgi:hypothetical protein